MGISLSASSLNSAMVKVYNYVFGALLYTGLIAFLVQGSKPLLAMATNVVAFIVLFVISLCLTAAISTARKGASKGYLLGLFGAFATVWGVLLAGVFAAYTTASIFLAFFSAAVLFLTMSAYGYFTKRDITGLSQYLFVGLIAIIIVSLVNIFLVQSSTLTLIVSIITVLLFLAITAYDAQKIRDGLHYADNVDELNFQQVNGALSLYLDFMNLFVNLLSIIGVRAPSND
jgi:hypothetical protein